MLNPNSFCGLNNTWRQKWQDAYQKASFYHSNKNDSSYWDSVAKLDGGNLAGEEHILLIMDYLRRKSLLDDKSDILDIGCGGGAYVVAFADFCRHVTALDYASGMLERCRARCEGSRVENVSFVLADFMDDQVIGKHDIIFACLNPSTYHPAAFEKMLSMTERVLVYFSMDTDIERTSTEQVYCGCNSVRYAEEYLKEQGILYEKIPYEYTLKMDNGEMRKIPFAYLVIAR